MSATSQHRTLIWSVIGVVTALAAVPLAGANTPTQARRATAPAVSLATATTQDFRVAVVATRSSAGTAPTAEVRVAVARRVGRAWRETGELRLPETYFWKTVTGPRALCRLEISTASSRSSSRPQVTVQVLQSPSLGCGPTHRYRFQ